MPDVDDSVLSIVQKAKEDEIEQRVYQRIKTDLARLRFFGIIGVIILGVLSIFHEQIFRYIVAHYADEVRSDIRSQLSEQIDVAKDFSRKAEAIRDVVQTEHQSILADLTKHEAEVTKVKGELENQLSELNELEKETSLDSAKVAQAQSTAEIAIERLKRHTPQLNALINNQQEIINALKTKGITLDRVQSIDATIKEPYNVEIKGTVYFHYSGPARELAKRVSAKLRDLNWDIPGEERSSSASGADEVRYHVGDKDVAEKLTSDSNEVLRELKVPTKLTAVVDRKARPGILEIWIHDQ
jgi:hypothetical protein